MATIETIRERISQIAVQRKNTTAADIDWVVGQLKLNSFSVRERTNSHATIYSIESEKFSICTHNRGRKQLKPCYVDDFLRAMINLGLYE